METNENITGRESENKTLQSQALEELGKLKKTRSFPDLDHKRDESFGNLIKALSKESPSSEKETHSYKY